MDPVRGRSRKVTLVQFGQGSIGAAMSARYLSGILRSHGYGVTIVSVEPTKKKGSGQSWDYGYYDLSDSSIKDIFEISRGSLFVGITVYSFVAHLVKKIYASEHNPEKIPIVVGGAHPTLDPYKACLFADYVCVGDGDNAIVGLADLLCQGTACGESLQPVAENVFSSAALRRSEDRPVLLGKPAPLDAQSALDYSFDSEYRVFEKGFERVTPQNAARHVNIYATFFSRGCVNDCSYCGHDMLAQRSGFQRRIKAKDVSRFVAEIKAIESDHPWASRVVFFDPNILSNNRAALKAVLDEYRRNVKLPLSVTGFTFNQINEEIYREFLTAGMDSVIFGIESGSEKIRRLYNRRENKSQIVKADALNQRLKKEFLFNIQYDVITDCPWEDLNDALESLIFISQLKGYDHLDIFSLRFLPGTRLFQKALEDGFLKLEEVDEENQRVFHSLNRTYENFLLLLMRDGFVRRGWLHRISVSNRVVCAMRWFFARHGDVVFRVYSSKPALVFVLFRKRTDRILTLLGRLGLKTTLKIVLNKLRTS